MGSMFTKERRTQRGADYSAEGGNAANKLTGMSANQPEDNSHWNEVFLHNPSDPKNGVNYDMRLAEEKVHLFVFKGVREDGLAYKTGFRSGDVLVTANTINIKNVDLEVVLKELLDFKEFNYLIGVERKLDDGENTFIWKVFKITVRDGVEDVVVLQTLGNDESTLPGLVIGPNIPTYDFLTVSSKPYNIFIEEDNKPPKYLAIDDNKALVFRDYGESSKFYQYYYADPEVNPGTVVAYSLYRRTRQDTDVESGSARDSSPSSSEDEVDDAKSSPATSRDKKDAIAMVFPKKMTGNGNTPDPRYWYKLASQGLFSLESMIAKGMYLGNGNDNKAILSTTQTKLRIARDEEFCESNTVE